MLGLLGWGGAEALDGRVDLGEWFAGHGGFGVADKLAGLLEMVGTRLMLSL